MRNPTNESHAPGKAGTPQEQQHAKNLQGQQEQDRKPEPKAPRSEKEDRERS